MRSIALVFGIVFAFFAVPASSTVLISSDKGGQIGRYLARYREVRQSGEQVVIDGVCLSACTIVLGIIPRDHLCVTTNAVLGFHAAWFPGEAGGIKPNREATQFLMKFYPPDVRQWISRRGGLTSELMFLQGRELAALVPPCRARSAGAVAQRAGFSGDVPQPRFNRRDGTNRALSADATVPR